MNDWIDDWTPGTACVAVPCAYCHQPAWHACTTSGGRDCPPHQLRWVPFASAYSVGALRERRRHAR